MATVGLVGSRKIDEGLQSSAKMTVTEFAFPSDSGTPNQISIPHEGAFPNKNPAKLGDCYASSVEDTNMCAPPCARPIVAARDGLCEAGSILLGNHQPNCLRRCGLLQPCAQA